jgi:hypothetical protein
VEKNEKKSWWNIYILSLLRWSQFQPRFA